MSWQSYVDTNLVGTGKVTHAAIIGIKGGCWAKSSEFDLTRNEAEAIAKITNAYDNLDQTRANGIFVSGVKYFTLTADERSIYGKKSLDGVVLVKTKQAILVGVYNSPIQQAETTKIVESLADYLISLGY